MKYSFPVENCEITLRFNEKSAHDSSHIHGALDFGAKIGTPILAPEDGYIFGWQSVRPKEQQYWPNLPNVHDHKNFAFSNYFYDMYGGVTFLESIDGARTHLFCHSYANQILNKIFDRRYKYYVEQKEDNRFPIFAVYTEKIRVSKGDIIGYVGAAGYCVPAGPCGAHLHWEIHPGLNKYSRYEDRIDPEKFLETK